VRVPRATVLACLALLGAADAGAAPHPPRLLPGDARAAASPARADTWLVGARPDGLSERIAKGFGARRLMSDTGIYRVERVRAVALVEALRTRGRYVFSEPDRLALRQAFPVDPLSGQQWGLGAIGATSLDPPPVGPESPLLAVVEEGADVTHPDLQGVQLAGAVGARPDGLLHGTAVASVAGAPVNGQGITGVWPGMRVLVATHDRSCGGAVAALHRAAESGARVISMSYLFYGGCFAHYVATQQLYGEGRVLVAAAGNEFLEGNPQDGRPATDPHVITVAGLDPDLSSADFSNENYAVDVSAPATGVLAAVPPALDQDPVRDGYMALDGTSFSAPMVAAATAWVAQRRPSLDNTRLTDLIRISTSDLGRRGWDATFGFGKFDLPRALSARAPAADPLEPNDNISWINGTYFRRADPPIYRGRTVRLSARLDRLEDPIDVYRIIVGARRAVRIGARPRYGDPTLEVYAASARSVYGRRGQIAVSDRPGRRLELLDIRNTSHGRRSAFVVVWPRTLDTGYRLQVRRRRF
jgi:hypothetical protein